MGKNNNKKRGMPKNVDPLSNAKVMSREGMKMIRNIAFGNFNFYNEGHVFRNPDFVSNTILEVDKRILDASIHLTALNYAYPGTQEPSVLSLIHRDTKTLEGYMLVRQTLEGIIKTGDTRLLYTLITRLPDYKYNL